ncbi:ribonuclease P 40kDa subunit-domain-containing protein [Lentinula aciculospora]|uniref:Ribonuclease P 40kDa subunit-domain-containing protein n=1 Tax=Lentinula aciculospora TaxID=153920 RepID=A0A9W9A5L0_9AGAR|nr:ribonuclease P 40kDa subunit-domain-containing protein [Lentinula aciculospora]
MNVHPRVEICDGFSFQDSKLENLARCHPFTQQEREIPILTVIDLIFPSNASFETAFETSLKAPHYVKGNVRLSQIVTESATFVAKYATQSGLSLLSAGSGPAFSAQEEDVWCIDHRGVLTLSVCKDTYNGLGLVGKRVAFGKGKGKQGDGRHAISIPLYAKETESVKIRAQREAALRRWEEQRIREIGSPLWNVLAFSESMSSEDLENTFKLVKNQDAKFFELTPVHFQKNVLEDIHVPVVQLNPRPWRQNTSVSNQEEEEDWYETTEGLFEWVGMAGFGATRLKANDRVDPFVAVYEPPVPARVGNVTHLKWTGFIGPSFVQSLIEFISHHLAQSLPANRPEFLSISSHACTWAPVSYISTKAQAQATDVTPPLRDPTREVEDSWCLVVTVRQGESTDGQEKCAWVLAESVGKHDSRLG